MLHLIFPFQIFLNIPLFKDLRTTSSDHKVLAFNSGTKCAGTLGITQDHTPIIAQCPGYGQATDVTAECSFDTQLCGLSICLAHYFYHVIDGRLYSQSLSGVQSTGAEIKCLHRMCTPDVYGSKVPF